LNIKQEIKEPVTQLAT